MLKYPNRALFKLIGITFILFIIGLLPWVDNYAHLFGFIFGFLLSYALMPYVYFGPYHRKKKIVLIWVCLLLSIFLFLALVVLFYVIPVYDCEVCSFLNCLPVTQDFCASQNINFKRQEPVVWRKWVRLVGTVCATNFIVTVGSRRRARLEVRGHSRKNSASGRTVASPQMESIWKHLSCAIHIAYGNLAAWIWTTNWIIWIKIIFLSKDTTCQFLGGGGGWGGQNPLMDFSSSSSSSSSYSLHLLYINLFCGPIIAKVRSNVTNVNGSRNSHEVL